MYETYGTEILNERRSLSLIDFSIQSYVYNKELTEEVFILYLKFDVWIGIFFDSGVLFIKEGLNEKPMDHGQKGDLFEYPFLDAVNKKTRFDIVLNKVFTEFSVSQEFELCLNFSGGHQIILIQEVTAPGWFGKTILKIK